MREAAITVRGKQANPQNLCVWGFVCALLVGGILVWQAISASGNPNPLALGTSNPVAALDIGVLVCREGLECVLVLAALTAGAGAKPDSYGTPIAVGAAAGFAATLLTWLVAIHILDDLSRSVSALALQAATGMLAVIVLLVVMNWFLHKLYWTGWISYHTNRKRELLTGLDEAASLRPGFLWGMATLGFTSVYREGFEVVLFLQSYRLRLGTEPVLWGVCVGLFLSGVVAVLTFAAHRRLPYRKMLVLTGILLGVVLIVMVGEQAQEMQLAHWIPTTTIPSLAHVFPSWLGLWFSVFPTTQTLLAQAVAAVLVLGSYVVANRRAINRATVPAGAAPAEIEQQR
jgi:high-affinity iron transporter